MTTNGAAGAPATVEAGDAHLRKTADGPRRIGTSLFRARSKTPRRRRPLVPAAEGCTRGSSGTGCWTGRRPVVAATTRRLTTFGMSSVPWGSRSTTKGASGEPPTGAPARAPALTIATGAEYGATELRWCLLLRWPLRSCWRRCRVHRSPHVHRPGGQMRPLLRCSMRALRLPLSACRRWLRRQRLWTLALRLLGMRWRRRHWCPRCLLSWHPERRWLLRLVPSRRRWGPCLLGPGECG